MQTPQRNSAQSQLSNGTRNIPQRSPVVPVGTLINTPFPTPFPSQQVPIASQASTSTASRRRSTRSQGPLTHNGRPYWVQSSKDWDKDGSPESPCSLELLIQWMEGLNNWKYFRAGLNGGTQKKGAQKCSNYLKQRRCPPMRSDSACQRKMNMLFDNWKVAQDFKEGTGQGQGGRLIADAPWQEQNRVVEEVDQECERLCPNYTRLSAISIESDGGTPALRADSLHGRNIALERFESVPRTSQPAHELTQWLRQEGAWEDDDNKDSEDSSNTGDVLHNTSGSAPLPSSGSINDSLHGKRSRAEDSLSETASSFLSLEEEYRQKRARHESDAAESTQRYRERKLELQRAMLEEERKKRRDTSIRELAKVMIERDSSLEIIEAMRRAKEYFEQEEE